MSFHIIIYIRVRITKIDYCDKGISNISRCDIEALSNDKSDMPISHLTGFSFTAYGELHEISDKLRGDVNIHLLHIQQSAAANLNRHIANLKLLMFC